MKKIVLTIYHTNISRIHIRYAIRLLCKVAGVQMIEIMEIDLEKENK